MIDLDQDATLASVAEEVPEALPVIPEVCLLLAAFFGWLRQSAPLVHACQFFV